MSCTVEKHPKDLNKRLRMSLGQRMFSNHSSMSIAFSPSLRGPCSSRTVSELFWTQLRTTSTSSQFSELMPEATLTTPPLARESKSVSFPVSNSPSLPDTRPSITRESSYQAPSKCAATKPCSPTEIQPKICPFGAPATTSSAPRWSSGTSKKEAF